MISSEVVLAASMAVLLRRRRCRVMGSPGMVGFLARRLRRRRGLMVCLMMGLILAHTGGASAGVLTVREFQAVHLAREVVESRVFRQLETALGAHSLDVVLEGVYQIVLPATFGVPDIVVRKHLLELRDGIVQRVEIGVEVVFRQSSRLRAELLDEIERVVLENLGRVLKLEVSEKLAE